MKKFDCDHPEITWSLCHPAQPELSYMERMLTEAKRFPVDSIEVCGAAHNPILGGLHGAVDFKTWPTVAAARDLQAVKVQRDLLNQITQLCHRHGKRFYYWHREIMLPPGMLAAEPGLLDEDGEFNLLGDAYGRFVKAMLLEFLEGVPDVDGIVLTLTEADYSVLHNSRPDRYPPVAVVERLTRIFADVLGPKGKRLILRSFGCIPQDYEDILAASPVDLPDFEIETKITPYDFNPFLPINPWLRVKPGTGLAVEHDALGEFLGVGRLPSANVEHTIRYVHEACRRKVSRHSIRLDRMHTCVFDSACRVNLDAFYAALANPNLTPESFWADWRPEINSEMDKCEAAAVEAFKSVLHTGFDAVTAALYIHGNLIFHKFPLLSDPKWFKAGGIPALFNPGASLKEHRYIWSILADSTAPSKAAVLQEKTRAIDQTRAALKTLNRLRGRLPEALLQIHTEAWRNLETLATVVHKLCCTVYEARDFNASSQPIPSPVTISTPGQTNGSYAELMIEPITQLTARIAAEVPAERALRQECQRRFPTVHDLILPGGLRDDGRCCRSALHASQAWLHESGMLIRQIGNPIFPNGWLEVELHQTTKQTLPQRLIFKGISNPTGFHLSLAGQSQIFTVILNADGWDEFNLPPEWSSHLKKDRSLRIRLTKAGRSYPQLAAILLV